MNDLIHELQLLDVIKFDKAIERFKNNIFSSNSGKQYIVVGKNYIVFEYNFELTWIGNKSCLNHGSVNWGGLHLGKCNICYQPKQIRLINGTGVPCANGKKSAANFYEYYSIYRSKKDINRKMRTNVPRDKLVIQQDYGNFDCITHFFQQITFNDINDKDFKLYYRWLKCRNIIYTINNIDDLLPEIILIIKRLIISLAT
jgi:hypothetical protein